MLMCPDGMFAYVLHVLIIAMIVLATALCPKFLTWCDQRYNVFYYYSSLFLWNYNKKTRQSYDSGMQKKKDKWGKSKQEKQTKRRIIGI